MKLFIALLAAIVILAGLSACGSDPEPSPTGVTPTSVASPTATTVPSPTATPRAGSEDRGGPTPIPVPTLTVAPDPDPTRSDSTSTPVPAVTPEAAPAATSEPTPEPTPEAVRISRSTEERDTTPEASESDVAALVAGNSAFAFDLYRVLSDSGGNLFFSPHSISLALAMAHSGARGETASQMTDALRYDLPQDRLHPAFNALDLMLEPAEMDGDSENFRLNVANSVWGQEGYGFLPTSSTGWP